MSDTAEILNALKEHREETRQDMHELRQAVVKIADAASDMGKTMARSEQRHIQHDEANKRIVRNIEDHEARIRVTESYIPEIENLKSRTKEISDLKLQLTTGSSSVKGGWKVLTVMGALFLGAVALASLIARFAA